MHALVYLVNPGAPIVVDRDPYEDVFPRVPEPVARIDPVLYQLDRQLPNDAWFVTPRSRHLHPLHIQHHAFHRQAVDSRGRPRERHG